MIYVDTSVWVAMHAREPRTAQVQDWLEGQDLAALCCSEWVKTEYASALSIKFRRGDLSHTDFADAHHAFARLCVAGPIWLDVEAPDFLAAAGFCAEPDTGLRAGDGLHLAVAVRTRCEAFLSLDNLLNHNAKRFGLRVVDL
jgi:predicted nucleic acid-binding protein